MLSAWAKPNCSFLNSDILIGVTKADCFCASGESAIWWYPEVQSNK